MSLVAKAGQDTQLLGAVRKQMEILEDRLSGQIARVQQQGDKMRDAAFNRYDNKLNALETGHPRLERRVAELSGNLRGLSDEMQCQIRRIDQTDSRLWEWRHQLEEDIRTKLTDVEQQVQQVSSALRVQKSSFDDQAKKYNQRLLRLEALVEDRVANSEDTHQSILQLHARLAEVEDRDCERSRELAIQLGPSSPVADGLLVGEGFGGAEKVTLSSVEAQCADAARRLDNLQAEFHEMLSRVESQEERYKSLRTLADTKDEQFRMLSDRLERENWDGRFKDLIGRMGEFDESRIDHSERLDILAKQIDCAEQAREELGTALRKLQEKGNAFADLSGVGTNMSGFFSDGAPGSEGGGDNGVAAGGGMHVAQCMARLDALAEEVESMRSDQDLGSRVATLVSSLKDIAPKVIAQESSMKQIHSDLSSGMEQLGRTVKSIDERVGSLERRK